MRLFLFLCDLNKRGQRMIGSRWMLGILGEQSGPSDPTVLIFLRVEFFIAERKGDGGSWEADRC